MGSMQTPASESPPALRGGRLRRLSPWVLPLGAACVMAATTACYLVYRAQALPNHLDRVRRHVLYRSAQPEGRQQWAFLHRHGIKTVVNLRPAREDPLAFQQERHACRAAGARMVSLPLSTTLPSDEQVLRFLRAVKWNAPVLVHCEHGRGRTGVMVAAYQVILGRKSARQAEKDMLQHGWTPVDSDDLHEVRQLLARLERDRPQWLTIVDASPGAASQAGSGNS